MNLIVDQFEITIKFFLPNGDFCLPRASTWQGNEEAPATGMIDESKWPLAAGIAPKWGPIQASSLVVISGAG